MWFVIPDLKTGSNGGLDNLTFGDDGICHVTPEQFDSYPNWVRDVAIVDGHTVRQIDGILNVESSEIVFWDGAVEYAGAVERATGIKFYMYGFVGNKDDLDRSGFVAGHASDVLLKKLRP